MTNDELLELVIRCIPFPNQIEDIDTSIRNQIRFTWRRDRFRVSKEMGVEHVKDGLLYGDNISILLRALLEREWIKIFNEKNKTRSHK